jgi:hypothetical protein
VRRPAQQREEGTSHPRRAHDVDVEQPPPLVVGESLDRAEQLHTDVRHDEVRPAEPAGHRRRGPVHGGVAGRQAAGVIYETHLVR